MVKLLLSLFQLLDCRLILTHTTRMAKQTGELHLFPKKSLIEYVPIGKIRNEGPSYRGWGVPVTFTPIARSDNLDTTIDKCRKTRKHI